MENHRRREVSTRDGTEKVDGQVVDVDDEAGSGENSTVVVTVWDAPEADPRPQGDL